MLNDESVKVEDIEEVIIVRHHGIQRELGEVRYVLKLERNLILLCILEAKGYTFNASRETLKFIRGNMMLMKGKQS